MSKQAFTSGTHLIDPTDPEGSVERLLAFHRETFGSATMEDAPAGAPAAGAPADGAAGADPAAAAPEQPKPGPPAGEPSDDSPWADPTKAEAEIKRLRSENAKDRTTAKQEAANNARMEVIKQFAKAAGIQLPGEEDAPDADKLAASLTQAQQEARQGKVELAVYRHATKHQGDPSALLDSRSFLAKLADLDPSSTDFQDKIEAAIKDAVQNNPKLKAVQATGASAVDHAGGTGEKPKQPGSLEAAVHAAYTKP